MKDYRIVSKISLEISTGIRFGEMLKVLRKEIREKFGRTNVRESRYKFERNSSWKRDISYRSFAND